MRLQIRLGSTIMPSALPFITVIIKSLYLLPLTPFLNQDFLESLWWNWLIVILKQCAQSNREISSWWGLLFVLAAFLSVWNELLLYLSCLACTASLYQIWSSLSDQAGEKIAFYDCGSRGVIGAPKSALRAFFWPRVKSIFIEIHSKSISICSVLVLDTSEGNKNVI